MEFSPLPSPPGGQERVDLSPCSSDGSRSARSFCEVVRGQVEVLAPAAGEARLASVVVGPAGRIPGAERLGGRAVSPEEDGGWQRSGKKRPRSRRRLSPVLPALVIRSDLPQVMAGRYFNCLEEDHVAALCRNPSRCRRCLKEGHVARDYRGPRSPPLAPPARLVAATVRRSSPPSAVPALPSAPVVLATRPSAPARAVGKGAALPAKPAPAVPAVRVLSPSAPVVPVVELTVEVARPVGALERRARLERCILPMSAAVDEAEAALSSSLVVHVVGGRGTVAASTVSALIVRACPLAAESFTIHRLWPANFLCVCSNSAACGALLGTGVIQGSGFSLSFNRWNRQLGATLRPFRYRVHVEMAGVPAHALVTGTADYILGPSCWVERIGMETASRADMGRFLVIAWTDNPERIARELLVGDPGTSGSL
ncbi:hypothetical protein BRADI_3g21471v3 [Brachypodium distachyon]|uniref:CCHC-type domain-containing protein n=1 Tax=Brachypodium distachyon TaxID=15368 RepID=A0A2K2CYP5_BRADI|nr:hypothetical protein BRADI_3g21471v3 [Brachypodium distachyon]